ncbi:MAG: DUF4185 domain-containing protein [Myxococcaceae bacterium]
MRWRLSLALLPLILAALTVACGKGQHGGKEPSAAAGEVMPESVRVNCKVQGAIEEKYLALGGPTSVLGVCTSNELTTADGVGRYNLFKNGVIYWSPDTGAHEVHGLIRDKWAAIGTETSVVGYPLSDEQREGACRVSKFQHGGIYYCPATGTNVVQGLIWLRYAALGGAKSELGAPTSDEHDAPGGRESDFQKGSLYWEAVAGITHVRMQQGRSPVLTKAYTEYLGRLTDTALNPFRENGLKGTDLGVSFERDGRLVILFGDSWLTGTSKDRWDDDSVAFSSTELPKDGKLPRLTWHTDPQGQFTTLRPQSVSNKAMNVPVEGLAVGATTYVFFSTGWGNDTLRHTQSVLAHTDGLNFGAMVNDHVVTSDKFINISAVRVGDELFLYGSGDYRKSPVYLARVNVSTLTDRNSWRYLSGYNGSEPLYSAGESSAIPVIDNACVGEFSVRKHPTLELLLMTYNCGSPRGILLHTSRNVAGPWSAAQNIFDPGVTADRGYEHFLHASRIVGFDDGLSEADRDDEWGGEYGPYLVPQWFTSEGGVHSIYYLLSSWNPYQVHLMRTVLTEPGATATRPSHAITGTTTLTNPKFDESIVGWHASGSPFALFMGTDGKRRITTYVPPANDAVMGTLFQDFTVGANTTTLSFAVHGGNGAVRLMVGPDIVRESRGRRTNEDSAVKWNVSGLRGQRVRLIIADELTSPWGYVGTTGFELK